MLTPIPAVEIAEPSDAKVIYEQTYSGTLRDEQSFGFDPLSQHEQLYLQREHDFFQRYNIADIYGECVNHQQDNFRDAVLFFIQLTNDISLQI